MLVAAEKSSPTLARRLLPPFCLTLCVLLTLARVPLIEWMPVAPALDFITIFYWTMARPNRVPPWLLFLLGLVAGSLDTIALGTHSLLYLGFYGVIRLIRRRAESFTLPAMTLRFALWFLLVCCAYWGLVSLEQGRGMPYRDIAFYWLVSAPLYPLMHLFFDRLLALGQPWKV